MRENEPDKESKNPVHKGHMWMMAICCGLPIIGLLAIAVLGISMPSLETLLFLICPIGMIAMMYFMHRDHCAGVKGDSVDKTGRAPIGKEHERIPVSSKNKSRDPATGQSGWFEA